MHAAVLSHRQVYPCIYMYMYHSNTCNMYMYMHVLLPFLLYSEQECDDRRMQPWQWGCH